MNQKKKNPVNQKIKILFILTPIVMILTMFLTHLIFNVPLFSNNDSTNWTTSVVETGIGTSITIAILIYSNNQLKKSEEQQEKITELVLNIQNIEQRNYKREQKRLKVFSYRIITNLEVILNNHYELRQELENYINKGTEEIKQSIILSSRKNLEIMEYFTILHIKSDIAYIGELFEDPLLGQSIVNQCNDYKKILKNIKDDSDWKNDALLMKISVINSQVEGLVISIDKIKKETNEKN
ncbi:MAG: hypothetical protein K8Q88_00565 [Nitrosarchaeum sp.]|nr:hypothetical protein [Nitrosarchaeum sp.]